ncbi:restriction endonuclease [Streptomyces sp. NPDC051207]|uniref:restriction endonuclease n=1 Tax=Streptomyces sp. NPDC051207 TaxID=3154641 RepID=UPI0034371B8F
MIFVPVEPRGLIALAAFQRRTRTTHRERPFDLRATAMFFALLAVLVCIAGWLGRAAAHVAERHPAWAVTLLVLVPSVAVAGRRGHRRFSAARLARRTGAALEEATTTALDALEAERAAPAPDAVGEGEEVHGRAVLAGTVGVPEASGAGEPGPPRRGEAETVVLAGDLAAAVVSPREPAEAVGTPALADYGALSPAGFEQAIAALCARDGCPQVEVVGGAGDLGADVLATTADGRRVVIQCKRYTDDNKVGSQELQRFGGTCFTVHEADVAVVVTTGDFTVPATEYAEQCGIVCVGGRELRAWSDGAMAPPWASFPADADAGA